LVQPDLRATALSTRGGRTEVVETAKKPWLHGATLEAFASWLHHRHAPAECLRWAAYRLAARYLVIGLHRTHPLARCGLSLQTE